jgi:magnesium transporter
MKRRARATESNRGPDRIPGTAPGTLAVDPAAPRSVVRALVYGPEEVDERELSSVSEIRALLEAWPVVWINVDGLGDERVLKELGEVFDLHRLALEDVINLGQRPKVEPYDNHLFVVAKMPSPNGEEEAEQLSMFLGKGFLLTVQERPGDWFDGVRERIRGGKGVARRAGSDYLAYALLDAVVDSYFPFVEGIGDEIEEVEEKVLSSPDANTVEKIHSIKRRLSNLRRVIGPHREAINALLRDSSEFVVPETSVHLRDCYDHLVRLTEHVEIYREQCSDLMNTYLSMVNNRMNEIMQVLTIMASIFIPLTFLAGVYGMNFDPKASPLNMPELGWRWGYPAIWAVMIAIAGGMILYFRRKRWW